MAKARRARAHQTQPVLTPPRPAVQEPHEPQPEQQGAPQRRVAPAPGSGRRSLPLPLLPLALHLAQRPDTPGPAQASRSRRRTSTRAPPGCAASGLQAGRLLICPWASSDSPASLSAACRWSPSFCATRHAHQPASATSRRAQVPRPANPRVDCWLLRRTRRPATFPR
jgi:hypothetical protein